MTLLWHDQLLKLGINFGWRRYVAFSLIVAPITVILAVLALAASTGLL